MEIDASSNVAGNKTLAPSSTASIGIPLSPALLVRLRSLSAATTPSTMSAAALKIKNVLCPRRSVHLEKVMR
eukprot:CAMPEP_0194345836 /NCGR_PEP_ID=MMETSP0171-20130528/105081_1 /TAXON_ID=218684 /ORGANISM="Corethron pennatum, Strain L29A3" /LENGTH=71 /DNA_ID=CAMNT_0039112867 /DNA_START=794 /DNA_END=1006 /DNA_ORIENTATION=+